MVQTISDLWNGDLAPFDNCGVHDGPAKELGRLRERSREALERELTDSQKVFLQAYTDASENYLFRMMELAFGEGFCLGSRLSAEALT